MLRQNPVLSYRWCVFAIALAFWLYQFATNDRDSVGWQFRYLTHWALTMSVISAWFMLRLSRGVSAARHEVFASVTVVVNIMVVFLYWKIYLTDPTQFYVDGKVTNPWHQEYYFHVFGPVLQWIDAFFVLGAFGPMKRITIGVFAVVASYLAWMELIVQPFNFDRAGSVTSGLPYRFLNNMEFTERAGFYAQWTLGAVIFLGLCWAAARAIAWLNRPV
jgi:hypothetical protein